MTTNTQRESQNQLVLGIILVLVAASIIAIIVLNLSIFYVLAMVLLLLGFYFILMSVGRLEAEPLEYNFGPTQRRFRFAWGTAFMTLGILGIVYLSIPAISLWVIVALLILAVGLTVLYYATQRRA